MFSHRGKGVVRIQFSFYFTSTHSRVIPCCDLYFFFSDPCLNGENCHNFSNLMVFGRPLFVLPNQIGPINFLWTRQAVGEL